MSSNSGNQINWSGDITEWTAESYDQLEYILKQRWIKGEVSAKLGSSLVYVPSLNYITPAEVHVEVALNPGKEITQEFDGAYELSQEISTNIKSGASPQNISLDGVSGSGKSTFFDSLVPALMRQFNVTPKLKDQVEKEMDGYLRLLDAMGNAGTPNNDKSSRYGKILRVFIDRDTMELTGMKIEIVMQERSRIAHSHHTPKQTNYLILRYLLAVPNRFTPIDLDRDFTLVPQHTIDTSERSQFYANILFDSLKVIGIDQAWLASYLAGILHLGNYTPEQPGDHLQKVAKCWAVDPIRLKDEITKKRLGNDHVQRGPEEICGVRDTCISLAMTGCVQYVTDHFNQKFQGDESDSAQNLEINIIDRPGIERFEDIDNSINQVIYSLLHETLRYHGQAMAHSIHHQELKSEGLDLSDQPLPTPSLGFEINRELVDIITQITKTVSSGSVKDVHEKRLIQALEQKLQGPSRKLLDQLNHMLTIPHDSGHITYNLEHILSNNLLGSAQTLSDIFATSKDANTRSMMSIFVKSPVGPISAVANKEITRIKDILAEGMTHSVYCIKPFQGLPKEGEWNEAIWDGKLVKEQCQAAGILHLVKLLLGSFEERMAIADFQTRFSIQGSDEDAAVIVEEWLSRYFPAADYFVGTSKVFLRKGCMKELDTEWEGIDSPPQSGNTTPVGYTLPELPDDEPGDFSFSADDDMDEALDDMQFRLDKGQSAEKELQRQLNESQTSERTITTQRDALLIQVHSLGEQLEKEKKARTASDPQALAAEVSHLRVGFKRLEDTVKTAQSKQVIAEGEVVSTQLALDGVKAELETALKDKKSALNRLEIACTGRVKDMLDAEEERLKSLCDLIRLMNAPETLDQSSNKEKVVLCSSVAGELKKQILARIQAGSGEVKAAVVRDVIEALSRMCQSTSRNKLLVRLVCTYIRAEDNTGHTRAFDGLGERTLQKYMTDCTDGLKRSWARKAASLQPAAAGRAIRTFLTDMEDCQVELQYQNKCAQRVVQDLRQGMVAKAPLNASTLDAQLEVLRARFPSVIFTADSDDVDGST